MKELKVFSWCDQCARHQERTEASTSPIVTLGLGGRPMALDLCEACNASLFDALEEVLADYGSPVGPARPGRKPATSENAEPPPRARSHACPYCSEVRSGQTILADHIWRDHLGEKRPPKPTVCPECGYKPRDGIRSVTTSVGKHRNVKHGYDPLVEVTTLVEHLSGRTSKEK